MIIRATVTKGDYEQGVEYNLPEKEARTMVMRGDAEFATVAPAYNREKSVKTPYEKRWPTK